MASGAVWLGAVAPASASPLLRLIPTPAAVGSEVTAVGQGFCGTAGCPSVTIRWDTQELATANVAADGSFETTFVVRLLPGQYVLLAEQAAPGDARRASSGFIVLPADLPPTASAQPPPAASPPSATGRATPSPPRISSASPTAATATVVRLVPTPATVGSEVHVVGEGFCAGSICPGVVIAVDGQEVAAATPRSDGGFDVVFVVRVLPGQYVVVARQDAPAGVLEASSGFTVLPADLASAAPTPPPEQSPSPAEGASAPLVVAALAAFLVVLAVTLSVARRRGS